MDNNSNTAEMSITKKKFPTALKVILIVLAVLVLIAILILASAHLLTPAVYRDFFKNASVAYDTPGIYDGAILQGYAYDAKNDVYLHTAYMQDGAASRIYIVNGKSKHNSRHVNLVCEDGERYTGHVGGIAIYNDIVFISRDGDHGVFTLSLNEIINAKSGSDIKLDIATRVDCPPSFLYADGTYLWVGEFNNDGAYTTIESHHFEVADGEENRAIVCGYLIDESIPSGLASDVPSKVLSIPNEVQGMAYLNGEWIFSASYGFAHSHLYFYEDNLNDAPDSEIEISGTNVPVWFLDNDNLKNDIKLQPMAEGIVAFDDKVYVSFESASLKYLFGNFTRGRDIYSYKVK